MAAERSAKIAKQVINLREKKVYLPLPAQIANLHQKRAAIQYYSVPLSNTIQYRHPILFGAALLNYSVQPS
jgi:hypothetical protein